MTDLDDFTKTWSFSCLQSAAYVKEGVPRASPAIKVALLIGGMLRTAKLLMKHGFVSRMVLTVCMLMGLGDMLRNYVIICDTSRME